MHTYKILFLIMVLVASVIPAPTVVIAETNIPIKGQLNLPVIENDGNKNRVSVSSIDSYMYMPYVTKRIAIIDTGVTLQHQGLRYMNVFSMRNVRDNSLDVRDDHGHGTHITGILAATGSQLNVKGLIPNAEYIIVKALNAQGETDDYVLADGIRHAVLQGAEVILISSGISVHSQTLESAVNFAHNRNVVIVAAAGNFTSQSQYPAAYSNVIAVGSVNSVGTISSFSPAGYESGVLAVGENVTSLDRVIGTKQLSGTSMAAPFVAALAMGLRHRYPDASADQIMSHIYTTSANSTNWNEKYGWGAIDFQRALATPIGASNVMATNNTATRAATLTRSMIISDLTVGQSHQNWYRLQTGFAGELQLTVSKGNSQALRLDLFDQSMRLIVTRMVTSNRQTVNFSVNGEGMYLRVSNNLHGTPIEYSLMTNFSISPDAWEANNTLALSKRVPLRALVWATIHSPSDNDWYHVDVQERGYLQVNVTNVPEHMDPILEVRGNNNRFVIDQQSAGKEERFTRMVEPGRYYINVSDYNSNIVNYPYIVDIGFTPLATNRFTDISNHWARNDINRLLIQSIVKGYDNNRFMPDKQVTRAEFATMLTSAMKIAYPESNQRTYRDIPTNHWAHYTVSLAKEAGMIQGYPDQTFRPDAFVTRAEMASMVYKMYQNKLRFVSNKNYSDVKVGYWAYTPINSLTRANILTGYNSQEFKPNNYVTRAEAATVISRLLNL